MMVHLSLSFPPSLNALYRTIIKGKRAMPIKSAEYRTYEQEIMHWHEVNDRPRIDKPGVVAITVHLYRPRAIGDADNYLKALLDVLSGHIYEDDSQIVEIHCFRHDDKHKPRVEVTVEEIPFVAAQGSML
jgi:Holliday junction resolvase RusA-like endonuclease